MMVIQTHEWNEVCSNTNHLNHTHLYNRDQIKDAVKHDDRNYCSENCAKGHPEGKGCGHTGCACHG